MPGNKIAAIRVLIALALIAPQPLIADDALAIVDGETISYEEFEQAVAVEARQKFYHAKPLDEAAYLRFRADVAQRLIDRKLKLKEAARRGIEPDEDYVASELASYEARYGDTERWEAEGEVMLARLRSYFADESRLQRVEVLLGHVTGPTASELRDYYDSNRDKFTEPERVRLSVILLKVPPTSEQSAWDAAVSEARDIAARIKDGLDFGEAARMHSGDATAAAGGDTGFLHAGTLGAEVQSVIDGLAPGDMAPEPIVVLEGVVLLRLEERQAERLRPLEDVEERAAGLWRREAEAEAMGRRVAALRASSQIELDEEYLQKLPN